MQAATQIGLHGDGSGGGECTAGAASGSAPGHRQAPDCSCRRRVYLDGRCRLGDGPWPVGGARRREQPAARLLPTRYKEHDAALPRVSAGPGSSERPAHAHLRWPSTCMASAAMRSPAPVPAATLTASCARPRHSPPLCFCCTRLRASPMLWPYCLRPRPHSHCGPADSANRLTWSPTTMALRQPLWAPCPEHGLYK